MEKQSLTLVLVAIIFLGLGFGLSYGTRVGGIWGVSAPAGMHGVMAGMNAQLQGKSGDAFDRAFLSEMIVHHKGAVEMAELALKNAKHQEIIDLAKAIIAAQEKEIADMKNWEQKWYGR